MIGNVATKTSIEITSATASGTEHRVLSENLERHGAYWASPDIEAESRHWNDLATDNEIHAAISTFNEAKEELKSRESVEFVLENVADGEVVLDLGCGYGRLAKYLLPVRTLTAYIGVDCSPVMLKKFHERYAATDVERTTPLVLVRGDIDRIPLQDASVDACIVSAVFLHNHKDVTRASIVEILRVLKPGGRVLVLSSFPNGRSLTGLQGWAFLAYLKLRGQGRKNGPVRYFGRAETGRLFEGFGRVSIRSSGFSVLPKTVLGMPKGMHRAYRRFYDRVHAVLERRLSSAVRAAFCVHFDVVARKDADA